MGKLVSVVGNIGAGKTTLVKALCDRGGFLPLLEDPEVRPFQQSCVDDLARWSLANQVDFYIARAGQEAAARRSHGIAVLDGGLDQDHHVFSRYLYEKGSLEQREYGLLGRTYDLLRSVLPPPDAVIRLNAPVALLAERRRGRGRTTEEALAGDEDLAHLETLLDRWLEQLPAGTLIRVASAERADFAGARVDALMAAVRGEARSG